MHSIPPRPPITPCLSVQRRRSPLLVHCTRRRRAERAIQRRREPVLGGTERRISAPPHQDLRRNQLQCVILLRHRNGQLRRACQRRADCRPGLGPVLIVRDLLARRAVEAVDLVREEPAHVQRRIRDLDVQARHFCVLCWSGREKQEGGLAYPYNFLT